MESARPEIFVLAGPNGAGKTTVADLLLPESIGARSFVNADFIAKGMSPRDPELSAFAAGRIMIDRLRELRAREDSFAFESTLASRTFAPFLREARAAGYAIHIFYVSLVNADLAVRRVQLRVERGGHAIPEDTVRRRYGRSLQNFFRLYRPLADSWLVTDNSGEQLVDLASSRNGGEPSVLDEVRWGRLLSQLDTDET